MYRLLCATLKGLVTLTVLGCGKAEDKETPEVPVTPATPAAVAAVAKGNNEFAFELYRQLAKEAKPNENIFFSPYSISSALAMTYAGARGKTAEEMAKVLRFDRDQDKFHPAFAEFSRRIRNPGKDFTGEINVANAIWPDQGLDIREPFERVMNRHYEAGLRRISFRQSEAARETINGWVAEQTRTKIKELLPKGAVNGDTHMVLTNAIYFHANWVTAFDKRETRKEPFYHTPKEPITVPMMHLHSSLEYAETNDVQIVALPYAGRRFSMVLLLPRNHENFGEVEKQLPQLGEWVKKLRPKNQPS